MSEFVAGLIGVVAGLVLNFVIDLHREKRTNRRADEVWRRDQFVRAATDLLQVAWELAGSTANVERAVHSLGNAEQHGASETVAHYRDVLQRAYDEHRPLPPRINIALNAIQVHASDKLFEAAQALAAEAGQHPANVLGLSAQWERYRRASDSFAELVRQASGNPRR